VRYYEGITEDLTAENTRLIIENTGLKRAIDSESEKEHLVRLLEEFRSANRTLINDNEDLRHKYEVAERLRLDAKE
jgi:hypothetical protein